MPNNALVGLTSPEAKKYQAIKNRLFLLNLILQVLFLFILVISGISHGIKAWLCVFNSGFLQLNALYFCIFSIFGFCLFFPLDYYEGFLLEHRFGLSKQQFIPWLKDAFKKGLLTFIVSLILIEAVYFFLLRFSDTWWLWAAGFYFFISVILSRIFPKIILPLFYKPVPLADTALRQRIFDLLKKFKIALKEVYVLDFSKRTVKANAMVAGLGATKQIFLSDTLVSGFSASEVEAVLAHELGHYVRRDTFKMVAVGLLSALFSFWAANAALRYLIPFFGFEGLSDIAGLPLFLLVVIFSGLILLPAHNGFMRFVERKADIFALKATNDKESFISMMQKLGKKNFADFSPSMAVEFFLYDHPPINKRIELARNFRPAE